MMFMFGGLWLLIVLLWSALPLIALVIALRALRAARTRPDGDRLTERLGRLETEVRELREELRTLRDGGAVTVEPAPAPVAVEPASELVTAPEIPPPRLDLEQRIGARWATWVGIVAILFAASFFLRWAFEQNLVGPGLRVSLGLVAGAALLAAGLALHRRRDVPYLSEGLAGGGLGILYLSLYAGHAFYGFLDAGPTFAAMFAVTTAGALVSVVSSRQATAVLTLLGGLLTPVLLASERPDERILLGYLFVLDLMVLAVARFRTWPALNWLAWAGTALLLAPGLAEEPRPAHLLARLALLSALFLLFLGVPLAREWSERARGVSEVDLVLVVANAAGYFGAVYWTLEASYPRAEGPYALALAVLYAAVAAESRRRVADDEVAVLVHLGVADVFLTLGIALAIQGPWITLAWAAQGVVFLSVAPRVVTPTAVWGGLAALLLAVWRVALVDPSGRPEITPTDLVHVAVVGCLVWAGLLARRAREDQLRLLTPAGLRALLWILAALLAALLVWRETSGLWPSLLLAVEVLVLAGLARVLRESRAPTFVVALPLVAAALLVRMLAEDAAIARAAAGSLVNGPLMARIAGCIALGLAGRWLAGSDAEDGARPMGRAVSAAAGLGLLIVLSLGWSDHQAAVLREAGPVQRRELAADAGWRTQVGLSVLWTLYAAVALGWGFLRDASRLRYAALGLLGIVILKVLLVDLAAVATVYRIVSFLILGVVLLGVSLLYQKARRVPA
jgi:uncharacterized membrane protein